LKRAQMNAERWQQLSLAQQLGHIGSEITRARIWQEKADRQRSLDALERALHLLDLSLDDSRARHSNREVTRLREIVSSHYTSKEQYDVTLNELELYCNSFALV
jgi:hypothetical protein